MAERGTMEKPPPPATMDASSLPPVPLDQILVLINRFIKSTGTFLNDFAAECDTRLAEVSKRVDKLQMEVTLLESKLPPSQQQHAADAEQPDEDALHPNQEDSLRSTVQQENEPAQPQASTQENAPIVANPVASAPIPQPAMTLVSPSEPSPTSDPRLSKYQGMIRVGIPKDAVVIKMQLDGLGDLVDKL